jgi:hypothetical protein
MGKGAHSGVMDPEKTHLELLEKKRLLDSELVLKFAAQLHEFSKAGGFCALGYRSMPEYCKSGLKLGLSTARYYLQVASFIENKGRSFTWDQWVALGPTKIRVLAALDPSANELVGLVKKYTPADISTRTMEAQLLPNRAKRRQMT